MAILAALFSVLAVYTYLILRKSVKEKKIVKSLAAAAIFIAAFGAGILSKENTILVLFVIAVLELFVLNSVFHDKVIYRLRVAFFFSLGALLTTVVVTKNIWGDGFAMRTFSLDDRILLQLPILGDYISKIVLPFASSLNLFEESFSENSSIYDSNIFLGLTVLSIAAAICSRAILKRNVIVMAAAVWFFGFHLLESTILPLELYFEHRNYLPSIGVIAIIVWGVVFLSDKNDSKILAPIILVSYGLFLSLTTYILSNTWGNETMLYAKFEQDSPESIRAHIAYSQHLEAKGLPELSLGLIQDAVELDPLLFDSVFTEARLRCIFYGEDISSIDWNRNYRVGFGIIGQIQLLDQLEKSYGVTCKDGSRPLLDSLRIEVPKMRLFNESKNLQGPFWDTLSDYYAERLNFEYAATSLENSVAVTNSARGYYKLAVLYASAGLYDSALINARKAIEEDTRRGRFSSSIGGDVYRFIEQIEKIHRRGINYD
ncbi:hypothetical protein [Allohahella sp. A8]|uniref:hypothetical protein n=1 Tax=Allohahella sp. A8 TaxID=3141461 RepID=UPI003A808364